MKFPPGLNPSKGGFAKPLETSDMGVLHSKNKTKQNACLKHKIPKTFIYWMSHKSLF